MGGPMKLQLPYLIADTDRHGNVRYYFRRKGQPKIRVHGEPATQAFLEQYNRARDGKIVPEVKRARAGTGTLRWLCEAYCGSTEFGQLGKSTGHVRRLILEGICLSKNRKEKERGGLPFALMQDRHIREIRDEKAEFPEAANSRLKALRQLFAWAKAARHVTTNPALEVERLRSASEGFHTWTDEEIAQFEAAHPIGTKARLAFALLRYTGVRRSDVVKLGKGMERDGALHFTVTKGALRKGRAGASGPKRLSLPILPGLRAILEATPSGHMTYLVTEHGKPFTAPGFGNKFRDWCNQAGLHHCSAHGIRKFDATAAAENGATAHQLMAMFGWDSIKQAEHYTRKASQQKLATGAMHLLTRDDGERIGDQSVPLPVGMLKSGTLSQN
jgi:site-specific recombinase XerD